MKTLTAAMLLALAATMPADAAIKCRGNFQVQKNGNEIATPWCQDQYLAIVAREYGTRVTPAAVRNNPGIKGEVCRFIGSDIRVRDTCQGYRDNRRGF